MVKFSTYIAVSVGSVLAMVCHAVRTRQQFYSVMFYLAHSRVSVALLVNMGLVMMCLCWQLTSAIFLGTLRETEVERLNEHFWREVMEILFAMTVFRDELNLRFVFWISVLLFVKTYHWLVQKRVEYLETTPSMARLSHVRLCTFMALLLTFDCLSFHRSSSHLLKTRQPSVSLFFAFEYAILTTTTITACIKYALHMREILCEVRSTGKDVYVFYVELVQDLLQLSMYLLFFLLIFIHYGLPLHLVRELYETFQNFKTRITDFIRYRRLTSNMNERFQDPTPEEISRDPTCIICREEMMEAKKLPCGHLFHVHCLRAWLERQHTCPTCRAPLLGSEDESEEQYDHDDEDVAQEFPDEEVDNDFMGDEYVILGDRDEDTNDASEENGSSWTQLQASTSRPTTQRSENFAYLAFSSGTTLWYPAFVPWFSGHLEGRVNPSTRDASGGEPNGLWGTPNAIPGVESNGRANNPDSPEALNSRIAHTNQWSYMPRILQTQQNPEWYAMPSKEPDSSFTHGTSPTVNSNNEGVMESDRTRPSTSVSQSLPQTVTWLRGTLDVSRYEEQNAYLERVIQVLKGQLQSAIDLQQDLNVMRARDRQEDSSSEVFPNTAAIESERNSHYSINEIDTKLKIDIQKAKDHCKHCPGQIDINSPSELLSTSLHEDYD